MERVILHCDLNSFFASVEIKENPSLRGLPVAVCGSVEDRHGIVLAKSEEAKKRGVKTGEAVWQAKSKCPGLVIASPHYEKYIEYSRAAKKIYCDYTDMVESFGIDECWLDVTGSRLLFGDGEKIAHTIRKRIKKELGITISAGVSYNKIFAKLGSDMEKPNAVTVITREGFRDKIWPLPACDMLGVGRSTGRKLGKYGIWTIGQLAQTTPEFCQRILGKWGAAIWVAANGGDESPVSAFSDSVPIKSVGHGNTARRDIVNNYEARLMILELSQDVARRLREAKMRATGVQLGIKDNTLLLREVQRPLLLPTASFTEISDAAYRLFCDSYAWGKPLRALTVRAINLRPEDATYQLNVFGDERRRERCERMERSVENIRQRWGRDSVEIAALMGCELFPVGSSDESFNSMPGHG